MGDIAVTLGQVFGGLSKEEQKRVKVILEKSGDPLTSIAWRGQDAFEVWENLQACCRAASRLDRVTALLKPVIGRMLQISEEYPMEFFESRGYRSFGDYMQRGILKETGVSTSEGYKLLRLAKDLSSVTPQDFREIGYTKLGLVSKIAKDGDSSLTTWIEAAKQNTTSALREMIYNSGNAIEPGSLEAANIVIATTKSVRDQWKEFSENPNVRAYCGSDSPGVILQLLMAEAATEWNAQTADKFSDEKPIEAEFKVVATEPKTLSFDAIFKI